jgi:hypothetical protein
MSVDALLSMLSGETEMPAAASTAMGMRAAIKAIKSDIGTKREN